jgi:glycosyltransferase involved in cell wall biosynthesis
MSEEMRSHVGSGLMTVQTMITVKDLPQPPVGKRGWPWTVGTKPLASRPDGSPWPKLSIVTPSYNQGQFLEATIRSVLLQGYPNLEYIIIDGGSSDESVAIIRKYERFLTFWVSEPDDGQTAAINRGLERSTGEYLGWLNSDDLYTKGAFGKAIGAFLKHPESIVVHGNRILLDADDRVIGWTPNLPFIPDKTIYNVCSETAFWTRDVMQISGQLNASLRFAMDLEFFSRLYQKGPFHKLDDYLGCFRLHEASKSSTIPQIFEEESRREWNTLFPNIEWQRALPGPSKSLLLKELLRHPLLIAIPYLRKKLIGAL